MGSRDTEQQCGCGTMPAGESSPLKGTERDTDVCVFTDAHRTLDSVQLKLKKCVKCLLYTSFRAKPRAKRSPQSSWGFCTVGGTR